jgi:hypothetical protein
MELKFGQLLIENAYDINNEPSGFIVSIPGRRDIVKCICKNKKELFEAIEGSMVERAPDTITEHIIPNY